MNSKTTARFRNALEKLPQEVRRQAQESYKLFRENHRHPSLQFKKVHTHQPVYSARISLDYRALCTIDGDVAVWFWIGSHADYEKLLEQL